MSGLRTDFYLSTHWMIGVLDVDLRWDIEALIAARFGAESAEWEVECGVGGEALGWEIEGENVCFGKRFLSGASCAMAELEVRIKWSKKACINVRGFAVL